MRRALELEAELLQTLVVDWGSTAAPKDDGLARTLKLFPKREIERAEGLDEVVVVFAFIPYCVCCCL